MNTGPDILLGAAGREEPGDRPVTSGARPAGDLDGVAQQYAGTQSYGTLSEQLDVTVAHPIELNNIVLIDKKADHVDAKELARTIRLNSVPESYVPTDSH